MEMLMGTAASWQQQHLRWVATETLKASTDAWAEIAADAVNRQWRATDVYALLGKECGDVAVEDGWPEDVDGAAGAGAGGQELDVDGLVDSVAVVEAVLVKHLVASLQELPPMKVLWHCRAGIAVKDLYFEGV